MDNERAVSALTRLSQSKGLEIVIAFDAAVRETYRHWSESGAIAIAAPSVIHSISSPTGLGSDSVPVEVTLNAETVYLTDSSQFTLELATRALKRTTYYIMPSFRGEPSDSTHLAEFTHAEVELLGTLQDAMLAAEGYVRSMSTAIAVALKDVTTVARERLTTVLASPSTWPQVKYIDVIDDLRRDAALVRKVGDWWMPSRDGELSLVESYGHGNPLWLTSYPVQCVPFYQAASDDPAFARCADLLVPSIGEVLGAGQRHTSSDSLRQSILMHSVEPSHYEWYIEMRDSYPATTSGFGIGLERLIAWLLELRDIGEIPILPRRNM